MPAYQAGAARVSSTVTKRNPRPRKYASASERQAAYRARAPEVCFRAEAKTVETLDQIAETLDQPRADVLLSMTKFALANHDWARFGLTHKPLPYGYGLAEQEFVGPRLSNPSAYSDPALWEHSKQMAVERLGGHSARAMQLAGKIYRAAGGKYLGKRTKAQKSLEQWTAQDWTTKSGKPSRETGERYLPREVIEGLTPAEYGATTRAKRKGTAAGQQFVKQPKRIAAKVAALKANPTMKKPTPAQLEARARFAEMARSGAFKKKAATKRKKNPVEGGKFQVGKYYETRSIGDADMKIGATILARTDKSVTVKGTDSMMKSSYRLTKDYNGNEMFYPWGRYSMAPMIGADDEKPKANPAKKTVSEKISQLTREGYPQKQAVAIALEEQRRGKVKRNPRASNPITETLIYGLPAGETRDYMEELLYGGGLKLTPEQIQKVLAAATAAGYHSFRITGFDPTVGAAFVRTMGQTRQRKRNPATGQKKSRTKLNPDAKLYTVSRADANGNPVYHLAHFRKMADAKAYAQAYADANKTRVTITSKVL